MNTNGKEYDKKYYHANKEHIRKQKREAMRRLRTESPEKYRKHGRDCRARLKQKVFDVYGTICACCGFDDMRALTLDHINNNGAEERKELGERGVYRRSIERYRPDEYRVLCMNCQFIKRVEANRQNQHS